MPNTHRDPVLEWLEVNKAGFPKGKVLEFGCGENEDFKNWFEKEGYPWTGLTPNVFNDKVRNGYIEDIKGANEPFDIIFSCHTFEHCRDPIKALENIYHLLNDKGLLILATPLCVEEQIVKDADWDHIFVLNEMQLLKLLWYSHFKRITCIKTGEHPKGDSIIATALR